MGITGGQCQVRSRPQFRFVFFLITQNISIAGRTLKILKMKRIWHRKPLIYFGYPQWCRYPQIGMFNQFFQCCFEKPEFCIISFPKHKDVVYIDRWPHTPPPEIIIILNRKKYCNNEMSRLISFKICQQIA